MAKRNTRRPQAPKEGDKEMMRAFQELRRSSAAQPHRNKARYNRKRKHRDAGW